MKYTKLNIYWSKFVVYAGAKIGNFKALTVRINVNIRALEMLGPTSDIIGIYEYEIFLVTILATSALEI